MYTQDQHHQGEVVLDVHTLDQHGQGHNLKRYIKSLSTIQTFETPNSHFLKNFSAQTAILAEIV